MSQFTTEQQEEINNVMDMLWTVQQLMITHEDLSLVDRGKLSRLICQFSDRWNYCKDEDQRNEFNSHLAIVFDLIGVEKDLSGVDRAGLAWLLDYLFTRLDAVIRGNL